MTPAELLAVARSVASEPNRRLGTTRMIVALLLLRQALEDLLRDFWQDPLPGMVELNWRVQLITLPYYLSDGQLAGEATYAWNRLSTLCHYDGFELPPTLLEFDQICDIVHRLAMALDVGQSRRA
jgi:hypothetical protein